jgi:hypothetical protein
MNAAQLSRRTTPRHSPDERAGRDRNRHRQETTYYERLRRPYPLS